MDKLLPCPFCGHKNFKTYTIGVDTNKQNMVKCLTTDCALWGKPFDQRQWNTRNTDREQKCPASDCIHNLNSFNPCQNCKEENDFPNYQHIGSQDKEGE